MNIKGKITDWQEFYINQCGSQKEAEKANKDLELVLFAIDKSTDLGGKSFTQQDARRIRSEASNEYCSDSKFLSMLNKESK